MIWPPTGQASSPITRTQSLLEEDGQVSCWETIQRVKDIATLTAASLRPFSAPLLWSLLFIISAMRHLLPPCLCPCRPHRGCTSMFPPQPAPKSSSQAGDTTLCSNRMCVVSDPTPWRLISTIRGTERGFASTQTDTYTIRVPLFVWCLLSGHKTILGSWHFERALEPSDEA